MNARERARCWVMIVATATVLFAGPAAAATVVVLRADAVARSAPFAVAPVVAHLDAGYTLTADDQPTNGWRRVRLPHGTFGFVVDDALQVQASPPPPAPAPSAAHLAAPVTAPVALPPSPSPALPDLVAARVKVFELTVRAQPSAAAPVLRVLPSGALLTVAAQAENGWRRTRLSDGQTAYVAEAGLDFGPAPEVTAPAAPVQPIAPAAAPTPRAKLYVADLEHLSALVAKDSVVSPMVESLVTRRQAAIATGVIGDGAGLLLTGLGLFVLDSSDCTPTGSLCTHEPNMAAVFTGLGVMTVSTVIFLALLPKRSDLFEVVNAWNPRHLDDQLTVETVPANAPGSGLF